MYRQMMRLVTINSGILAVGLLALEIVFGSWVWSGPLDRLLIPRNSQTIYHVETPFGKWASLYTKDEYGFRGAYDGLDNIDILTIGGSTTDQRMISDPDTWQAILSNQFLNHGRKVSVVSAAVDGHTTVGHIKTFELWLNHLPNLQVKWVLAYIGINDRYLTYGSGKDALKKDDIKRNLKRKITNNSALYHIYRTVRGMIEAEAYGVKHMQRLNVGQIKRYLFSIPALSSKEEALLMAYELRIRNINDQISSLGARSIFVTQPLANSHKQGDYVYTRNGIDPTGYYWMRRLNDKLMEVCLEVRAVCIDLQRDVKFGDEDFYDNVHNMPSGAKKIGEYLFLKLQNVI